MHNIEAHSFIQNEKVGFFFIIFYKSKSAICTIKVTGYLYTDKYSVTIHRNHHAEVRNHTDCIPGISK